MRDDGFECSEESLSALLDNELDLADKRAVALHVAVCVACAQTLGQLLAARTSVSVPAPGRVALPRRFWRTVRERLDEVDGLVRATDLVPQRRRPIVSPRLAVAAAAALMLAVVGKAYLAHTQQMPLQLTRLHLAGTIGPYDAGLNRTVGISPNSPWQVVSHSVVTMDGVMVLRTVYSVDGIPVSVFRLPPGGLDTRRLAPLPVGGQTLYLAGSDCASMVARPTDQGWQVVVSRSPVDYTVNLALSCPRQEAWSGY